MPKAPKDEDFDVIDDVSVDEDSDDEILDRGDSLEDEDDDDAVEDTAYSDDDDEDVNEEEDDDENEEDDDQSVEDEQPRRGGDKIPKSRFDEVIDQRNKEREQNRILTEQMAKLIDMVKGKDKEDVKPDAPKFEYDFDAKEAEYMDAVLEGDTKLAASIRKEIRSAEQKMFSIEQEQLLSKATESARSEARKLDDDARFEKAIGSVESKYPFLDQGSDTYNQEAVDKVNSLFSKLVRAGASKSEALVEAVDLIAPGYAPRKAKANDAAPLGKRKQDGLKRNARANNAQPPRMAKGKSAREKSVSDYDITNMSESDFEKLPAQIKRKLRGD